MNTGVRPQSGQLAHGPQGPTRTPGEQSSQVHTPISVLTALRLLLLKQHSKELWSDYRTSLSSPTRETRVP